MFNQLNISSGHSINCKGASHFIDEVTEARKVVNRIKEICDKLGVECYTYHDSSNNSRQNLKNIVEWHNKFLDGLDISIHFNACSPTNADRGTEVWVYSQGNFEKQLIKDIADSGNLLNRGVKTSRGFYFLKNTAKKSILIELCFVDSQADVNKYKANFENICRAIVKSLTGKMYVEQTNPTTNIYKVQVGAFKNIENAKKLQQELKSKGYDSVISRVTK